RAGRPRPGEARARRQGRPAGHRRRVPGGQGVPRRLLDRRRRHPRAGLRDRGGGVRRARTGRRAAQHGDRSAAGDERAAPRSAVIPPPPDSSVELLLRDLAPQVLGARLRRFRDFTASEDAVQEALIAAAAQWPRDGVPANPRGWLIQVASRRLADHVPSETARRRREATVVSLAPPESRIAPGPDSSVERDDTLALLFLCCHPALSTSSAIALTLRAVGGLKTAETAAAFLVPEATMAQRISRAKQSIKASGVPFQRPT